jgi:hypothetical protein
MRHLLLLLMALPLSAADYITFATNLSLSTNVFQTAQGPAMGLYSQPLAVSASVSSPAGHAGNTVKFYFAYTTDGSNWTRTNEVNTLVASTTGVAAATTASNIAAQGYSGIRLESVVASTVTNVVVSNFTLGTWHLQR